MKTKNEKLSAPRRGVNLFTDLVTTVLVTAAAALLCFAPKALADQSFQTTNTINPSASFTSFPTNNAGLSTGKGIDVNNYFKAGFVFRGLCTASNNSVIGVGIIRGSASGGGTVPYVTNAYSEWETAVPLQQMILVPIPQGTNQYVCWMTNLDDYIIMPGDQVGIYKLTNNLSGTLDTVTNASFNLHKKIVPLRYP